MTSEGLLFSALCGTNAAFPLLGNAAFLFHFPSHAAVGYQNIEGKTGFTMMTPTFVGIGTDYDIQALKLSGAMGYGGEQIQFVDSEGNSPEYYTWFDASMMGVSGWYDQSFVLSSRVFDSAESFLVSNDAGNYTIDVSGQVAFDGIPAFDGVAGFTSIGNFCPISKTIQKFVLTGAMGYGGEQIQFIDEEGNSPEYYTWFDASMMGVSGWYDPYFTMSPREIAAGEGFMVSNDAGNYTISVPGVND